MGEIDDLQALLRDFAMRRAWTTFHNPKNLAMAVAAEAGELLAEFQLMTAAEAAGVMEDREKAAAVQDEVADVAIYLLRLADVLGISVADVVRRKTERNEERFPDSH